MSRAALFLLLLLLACTHRRAAGLLACPRDEVTVAEERGAYQGAAIRDVLTGGVTLIEPFHSGWTRYVGCGNEALCFDDLGAMTAPADRCLRVAAPIPEMIAHSVGAEGHRLACSDPVVPAALGTHWTLSACGRTLVCIGAIETKFHAIGSNEEGSGYACERAPAESALGHVFRAQHHTFSETFVQIEAKVEGTDVKPEAAPDMAELTRRLGENDPTAPLALVAFHERIRGWRELVAFQATPEAQALFARWLFLRRLNERALEEAKAALARGQVPGMHLLMGHILADEGRLDEAEAELRAEDTVEAANAIAQIRSAAPPSTAP